ncbi:MAG TPA: hypothetical protein VLG44_02145 [Chlamydiales bacterium]|nr:hypothetical protein [Chlamydiales bacterium]
MAGVTLNLSSSQTSSLESLDSEITVLKAKLAPYGDLTSNVYAYLGEKTTVSFQDRTVTFPGLEIDPGTSFLDTCKLIDKRLAEVNAQLKRIAAAIPGFTGKSFVNVSDEDKLNFLGFQRVMLRLRLTLPIVKRASTLEEKIAARNALLQTREN